jgi:hypothetical protein
MGFQIFVANLFDIILGRGYLAGFFGISTKRGEYVCSEGIGSCHTVGVCSRLLDDTACQRDASEYARDVSRNSNWVSRREWKFKSGDFDGLCL